MKINHLLLGFGVFITLGLSSCSQDESTLSTNSTNGDIRYTKEMLSNPQKAGTIEESPQTAGDDSKDNELSKAVNFKLSLLNTTNAGKQYLTWNNDNDRVTFSPAIEDGSKKEQQEFYIEKYSDRRGDYIIYARKHGRRMMCTLGQAGDTKKDIILLIDYEENKDNLDFCVWSIRGKDDDPDFVIENNDYVGMTEKFRISISEPLVLEKCTFLEDTLQNVAAAPDFIIQNYHNVNAGSTTKEFPLPDGEKATETSSFPQSNSIGKTFAATTVLIDKLRPTSLSDNKSVAFVRRVAFGEDSTTESKMDYTHTIKCPAYSSVDIKLIEKRIKGTFTYEATCRGADTGNYYNMSGTWEGISCISVEFARKVTPLKSANL